ncbi:hypothetical protein GCM10027418_20430 [Mariniluteicoccus endophyticus]
MTEPRAYAERRADTLALLSSAGLDGWVATVGPTPHVTPVPIAWHQETVLVAIGAHWPTARRLEADPRVRVAVGGSRDCVVIDAEVSDRHSVADMRREHPDLLAAYEVQSGHSPGDDETMFIVRPRRIQAWRGECESADRTLMHDGCWLVQPTSD